MVKIRLRRMGAKKQPTYRFVVADDRSPRDGKFLEILGHYNPRTEPKTVVVDQEKAKEWLAKGAQPSDPVRRLFAELGLVERALLRDRGVVGLARAAIRRVAPEAPALLVARPGRPRAAVTAAAPRPFVFGLDVVVRRLIRGDAARAERRGALFLGLRSLVAE